ncbi:MAG: ABC transporter permease, partial [Ekhidna sp.]|nr:ABC transporter permease [Ekhidna sp.]
MSYYLRITIRNFLKHKVSSIINLVGLTTGLSCAFFIYLWVQDEFTINKFHEKDDRLFRVMEFQTYSNEKFVTNSTPGILGQNLKIDFPDIQYAATTTWINPALLSFDNQFFKEEGYHVGKDFFNIFSYPLLAGNANDVLKDKTSICISRNLAEKFFGDIDAAMGKTIRYEDDRNFIVSGVFENITTKSTYIFDFVLPLEDFLDRNEWAKQWGNNGPHTFVVLKEGASANEVTNKIAGYIKTREENSHV